MQPQLPLLSGAEGPGRPQQFCVPSNKMPFLVRFGGGTGKSFSLFLPGRRKSWKYGWVWGGCCPLSLCPDVCWEEGTHGSGSARLTQHMYMGRGN